MGLRRLETTGGGGGESLRAKADLERDGGMAVESGQPKNKCVRCVLNAFLE